MQATLEHASNVAVTRWRCEPPDLDKFTTFHISFSGDKIYSIQFAYDNQAGKEKESPIYGVTGGVKKSVSSCYLYLFITYTSTNYIYLLIIASLYDLSQFLLDNDEKITLISGTRSDTLVVTSLTFSTNKGNTYTYGDGGGKVFNVPVDGKIIGFHGSYGDYLATLAVIV